MGFLVFQTVAYLVLFLIKSLWVKVSTKIDGKKT